MKTFVVAACLLALAGGAAYKFIVQPGEASGPAFRTAPVVREDFVVVVNSTGTVEPEEVVDVGAQVAGRIVSFGKDSAGKEIDYGSQVAPDTVLALIDDSLYREEANQSKADVAKARATAEQARTGVIEAEADVARAHADLKQMQAVLRKAERDWARAQQLIKTNVVSQQDYDTYQAAYETASAALGVGDAALVQMESALATRKAAVAGAQADIDRAQASLNRAEKNLGYTTIKSPISGVIVDRRVNIGQTVVASLNAPSLFLIAQDLSKMQVWASVNEADIGRIQAGQAVRFTVDAHPGATFSGTVSQIRLNASMTQNVVTYTVVVTADNSSGKLLPYLTANLQFEVMKRSGALLVPNSALRWKPRPEQISGGVNPAEGAAARGKSFVWVQDGAFVRPLEVKLGATDGTRTEISGGDVMEKMELVIGEIRAESSTSGSVNPFAPKVYGSGKKEG